MTTLLITLALMSGSLFTNSTGDQVSSEIKEAIVYRNGALITRTATVQLIDGKQKLVFNNLTANLRPATIQLGGDGRYTLLSLSHDFNYLQEIIDNDTTLALKKRKAHLEEALKRNQASTEVEKKRERFLNPDRLINDQEKYTTAELQNFLEFYSQQSLLIQNKILDLNNQRQSINEELNKVTQQLNELNRSFSRNTSEITVELESNSAQTVEFEITYLINNAGWQPTYDIRVDDTNEPVEMIYKASIYQNSGYDWNDIQLSVSSANPNENAVKPNLNPWYIDFFEPRPMALQESRRDKIAVEMDEEEVYEVTNTAMGDADKAERKQSSIAEFNQQATSFTYVIDRPYSIATGKGEFTAIVSINEVKGDFSYAAVPNRSQNAFLVADITDWGNLNLLAGAANLYFENTYIGRTGINPFSVDDTLNVSLGTDKSIIINRNNVKDFEERRFFGSKTRETKTFEISIRNTKSEDIEIKVEDQIPVSLDEGIKVSAKSLGGASFEKETGFLTWNLNIPAGETVNLRFSYEVEYPKGKQINF